MVSSGPTLVSIEVFKILFFRRVFVTFFIGACPGHTSFKIERSLPKSIYKHSEARNDKYPRLFYTGVLPQNGLTLLLNLQTEFLAKKKNRELLNFSWRSLLKRLWLPPLSPCSSFIFHLRSGLPLKNQTDPRLSYPGNGRLRRI